MRIKSLVLLAVLSIPGGAISGGLPVFDGTAAANFVQQFVRMKEQLDTARSQLTEAERMYASVTGNRGLGNLLRDSNLRQYLPEDAARIYDSIKNGNYPDITSSIDQILRSEQITGSTEDAKQAILEREKRTAAVNKAMGIRAFEGARRRLDNIERLMDEISQTQDQKAIDELQARIAGEQAAIQNEMNKLVMLSQLQNAEQQLIKQQRKEISREILSSKNTGMARIQ